MRADNIYVLLIDDDKEFNSVLTNELRKTGFETNSPYGGNDLFGYIEKNPCDVILMDIDMPVDSG